jgi:hypothetical protein
MQGFYVVAKSETGWKSIIGIRFSTLEEAIAARAKLTRTDARISNALPASVGCGWTALDSKHIIA